jgi:chemotaxis signal transduction protein
LKLSSDQIQSPPVTIDAAERAAIQGVARVEDRLVVVLDSDKLLNVETWAVADLPAKID